LTTPSPAVDTGEHAGESAAFFAGAEAASATAADRAGRRDVHLEVAGQVVRLGFAGDALVPVLLPAVRHLEVAPVGAEPALHVGLFDTASTGVPMPPPPWGPDAWGAKGEIAGFNDDRIRTVYDPGTEILHVFDAARSAAVYWAPAARTIPWWESSFPLRTILHWWSAPTSRQPVHSGAVARDGVAVLVAGPSGSGKSTTTLACLEGGLGYLGDDYVLLDVDESSVHSLYSTAKLEPDNLHRFPDLAELIANADRLDTQKAMLFLHEHRPEQLVLRAPLGAVLLPRIARTPRTTLAPAPASAAMSALAPTTLFQLPGYGRAVHAKCSRLVRSVPSYWLDVGEDLPGIAGTVGDLLGDLR
jgi:hypothetical protein